jgi:hypothetical protein
MFLHAAKPFPMSTFRIGLMHGRSFQTTTESSRVLLKARPLLSKRIYHVTVTGFLAACLLSYDSGVEVSANLATSKMPDLHLCIDFRDRNTDHSETPCNVSRLLKAKSFL